MNTSRVGYRCDREARKVRNGRPRIRTESDIGVPPNPFFGMRSGTSVDECDRRGYTHHEWCAHLAAMVFAPVRRETVVADRDAVAAVPARWEVVNGRSENESEYGGSTTALSPEQRGVRDRNMSEAPVPPVDHLAAEVCITAVFHVIKLITGVTAAVDGRCSLVPDSQPGDGLPSFHGITASVSTHLSIPPPLRPSSVSDGTVRRQFRTLRLRR